MISKESAQVLLKLLAGVQVGVSPDAGEVMASLVKAQAELQAVLETNGTEVLTFPADRQSDGLVAMGFDG